MTNSDNEKDPKPKEEEKEGGNPDMKNEVREEEMKKDDKDLLSYRAYSCTFFNVGDPFTHILEHRRWIAALRTNLVLNHTKEMILAIIGGEIGQNENWE